MISRKTKTLSCFKITAEMMDWTLCNSNPDDLSNFREELLKNIIIASGIATNDIVTPKEPSF